MFLQQSLEDHFGEDITFDDKADEVQLINYLINNAAERSSFKRSKKIMRSLPGGAYPLKISETPYIKRKHEEIPKRLITQPEVGSIANCDACHQDASKGIYDDDEMQIPNARLFNYD